MQTTVKQQAEELHKVLSFFIGAPGSTATYKPTPEGNQALHDLLDTVTALKLINFEEMKLVMQKYNYQPAMDAEGTQKYIRSLESLDLLIETFRG